MTTSTQSSPEIIAKLKEKLQEDSDLAKLLVESLEAAKTRKFLTPSSTIRALVIISATARAGITPRVLHRRLIAARRRSYTGSTEGRGRNDGQGHNSPKYTVKDSMIDARPNAPSG